MAAVPCYLHPLIYLVMGKDAFKSHQTNMPKKFRKMMKRRKSPQFGEHSVGSTLDASNHNVNES